MFTYRLRRESGFTLFELLVVMVIIAFLIALGYRSGLLGINRAENLGAQARTKHVFDDTKICATEADDTFGSYENLVGDFCLKGEKVDNTIPVEKMVPGTGEVCWHSNADSSLTDAVKLVNAPAYPSVGICTFEDTGAQGYLTVTSANGGSTGENGSTSRWIRVSTTRNGKTYTLVQGPDDSVQRCVVPLSPSTGEEATALKCSGSS